MILDFLVCFISVLLLQIVTPYWWWVMLVPLIFGVVRARTGTYAFLLSAACMGSLWFTAGVYDYLAGSRIIAFRVAQMITSGSVVMLFALTMSIAALSAGIAGFAGYMISRIVKT